MSCYEWEQGTIKLPTKIFAKFRREFIDGYNNIQQQRLNDIKDYRETALRRGAGQRGFDFQHSMHNMTSGYIEYDAVSNLFPDDRNKPLMPTKKMFNFVNSKDNNFAVDEGGITFNKKAHTVTWSVPENNHACEAARGTKEAILFFQMLRRVTWTRGSGGVIVGNNEYNGDDMGEGGGGNYVTDRFGK